MATIMHIGASVAFCLLIAPIAIAHGGEEETVLFVEAFDDDGFYFKIEGYDGKNPTIVFQPDTTYHINFYNRGTTPHNFRVHELPDFGTPMIEGGESAQLEFTVPTSGLDAYWCDPHRDLGMEGKAVKNPDDLKEDAPGWGIISALGALGLVMMIRRRG
ncbi:MAG: cupredoxin domain-containing protein [Thermoplasmatota archaeon]